uniref:Tc1-like transposase DDE domain-containing protein n=1 Tax=Mycena chlorophos TaxID=658473 RepID=A0ABQ0L1Y2_MYCCL|nr:predicted protein [Mycena chlorophos]
MAPNSRRKAHWDSPTKNRVVGAVQAGKTIAEAARLEGMPDQTARDLIKKFDETERQARKNRRTPFKDIGNLVEPRLSQSSVRRALKERGYRRCVAQRVPFIKPHQKVLRLEFAEQRRRWGTREWRNVLWSDECYVELGKPGRIFVTRRPDEKWEEECLVPKFSQSPIRVMVWGCIARGYRGGLKVLELLGGKGGGLTAARYQELVLEDMVLPEYRNLREERPGLMFQQDSAPAHRAKTTQQWLENHNIKIMPHPPNSPDVSPIEPLWNMLKDGLSQLKEPPTTRDGLIAAIIKV